MFKYLLKLIIPKTLNFLPALAAAAPFVAAGANYFGQKETNKTNWDISNQTNAANAANTAAANAAASQEADKNRQFQDTQRSTAYQAATADLRKAGLNPALAYQQGGAQAMSGAPAPVQAARNESVRMEANRIDGNSLQAGISSAFQAKMAQQQFKQTELMNQEALRTQATQQASNLASASQAAAQAEKTKQDKINSIAQLALSTKDQTLKQTALNQTLKNQQEQARLTNLQGHSVSARLGSIQSESDWAKAQTDNSLENKGWLIPMNRALDTTGRIMSGINSAMNVADWFRPKSTSTTDRIHPKTGEIHSTTKTTRRR